MVASQTSGELQLVTETRTELSFTKSSPKTMPAIAIVSSARSFEVTMPMNGLSECFSAEWTIWRWRFGTGISIGSQTMELEECSAGDM